ncbi:unnamed protein product [Anisakis simplex]|uniref:Transposase n=1 Tax=Anisakis simplex TaxID=6269 RepID=A0A0M3JNK0_ANISI|nr:unnamed protein product [Anisakis simplex]
MVPTAREQQLFEKLKKSPRRLRSAYHDVMVSVWVIREIMGDQGI